MSRLALLLVIPLVTLAGSERAEPRVLKITVSAGKHDRTNVPVRVPVQLHGSYVRLSDGKGEVVRALLTWRQLVRPFSETSPDGSMDLNFVLPSLKAGASVTLTCQLQKGYTGSPSVLHWRHDDAEADELRLNVSPVLRYVRPKLDESSKQSRELTYKPFHHLFDPDDQRLVTKGPGGLYTHHRGLFFGFNKVSYGDKKADVWHCSGDAYQSHEEVVVEEGGPGPVLGRHRVRIDWHGPKKEVFARETREVTVYNLPGGTLLDFASRVESKVGKVKLDGDPQHAGFHFRADNEVAEKTKGQTYFLRPDGKGKPGETRNWPAQKNHVNLPWNAMSFVLGDQRYTALYLDHPANPKEARFSERDYGRFGSYFEYELDEKKPLEVRYRLWLQKGEMTVAEAARLSADFVEPPTVKVE